MDPVFSAGLFAILGTLLGAAATHFLEKSIRNTERAELTRRAEGRVSMQAYALQRQIESWLADWPKDPYKLIDRLRRRVATKAVFDIAEGRVEAMVAESLNASAKTARQAQEAFALFYHATGVLNEARAGAGIIEVISGTQDARGANAQWRFVEPWGERVENARQELERCRATLREIVDPRLNQLTGTAEGALASGEAEVRGHLSARGG